MKHSILIIVNLFLIFATLGQATLAGQISVINPSAGSEITGVASISPPSSSSQSSYGLSTSNNISLLNQGSQKSSKYKIYKDFFNGITFERFTEAQLVIIKTQLLDVLSSDRIEYEIKGLIKEQLDLVAQRLE